MKFRRKKNNEPDRAERRRWRRFGTRRTPPRPPDLEPEHDQPWVPTSGLTDRLRRSPREVMQVGVPESLAVDEVCDQGWRSGVVGAREAAQHLSVVGSLVGRRVRDRSRADTAPRLRHRLVLVVLEPRREAPVQGAEVLGTVDEQRRGGHHDVGPGQQRLDRVLRGVDAGRQCERARHPPVEQRDPAQREPQLGRGGEVEGRA